MTKTIKIVSVLCLICFFANAQSSLDCMALQQKVKSALTDSKSMRIDYSSSDRNLYVDFEKDSAANTHLWVRQMGKNYTNQAVIRMADKVYYAKSDMAMKDKSPIWETKVPAKFPYEAWMDSCNNATKVLNKPFLDCTLRKETKITGTPYAIYAVAIESDTFKILLNKTTNKIETISSISRGKDVNCSWEFDMPFTITAPPTDLTDKYSFGFSAFPPSYSYNDDFDGDELVYVAVDKLPEFKGGQKKLFQYLGQNIIYPKFDRENGIEGIVYIGFVVEKDGHLSNFHLKRGISQGCNAEAMQVVKSMGRKWDAGWHGGQKVRVAYTLPIKFKLE